MTLARAVLGLSALAYGGVGLAFLIAPAAMGGLVGLSLRDATADNDVRAVYGGLGLGFALFCLLAAARDAWMRPALAATALTLGGMASARVVSWVAVGRPGPLAFLLHAAEVAGCAAAVAALSALRGAGPPGAGPSPPPPAR